MKLALTLSVIFFLSIASFASTYHKATVVFADGKSKTGLVESTLSSDYILFKISENAKEEKIESSTVKAVILTIKNEPREFHFLKVYLGWGQKRISDPQWLRVVEKGIATLYIKTSVMSDHNGLNKAGFEDYFCIRAGEPAAKMIANISSLNNNQTFRAKAPLYFADYPELATKIKSKEYTWRDLQVVAKEYNA